MVKKDLVVSMYRSHKETFEEEIIELNRALNEIGINCEVISQSDPDGETLLFRKRDL